jgi:pyridoxamine 5'-phosphate oxidase
MNDTLSSMRREYGQQGLHESDARADPMEQFRLWFDAAEAHDHVEANAMTLATVDARGQPSARTVLLKDFDADGFVFYTNRGSRKAAELAANPRAALLFWWRALERQIRIEGPVEAVAQAMADTYFARRPRGSQLGAWASRQSAVIENRNVLRQQLAEVENEYAEREVPRPPFWGGFRVRPEALEFWQGRESRLHDRLRYRLDNGRWRLERLAP